MPRSWRLLVDEGDGRWNMALDEAIALERPRIGRNTLRVYRFSEGTVTIGRFQRAAEAVNLGEAARLGIPVIRRVTGGGAVYHDPRGEVTYSVVIPERELPSSVLDSYRTLCSGVVRAAEILGAEASFSPINDVIACGRKVSGSAQARLSGAVLQHGTLMYASDLDLLAALLRPPREKLAAHGASDIRERVTTISECVGRAVDWREASEAVISGFSEALDLDLREEDPTEAEIRTAERLVEERYSRDGWNLSR